MRTTTSRNTAAAINFAEKRAEAHRLISKLTAKIDSVDPDAADWGHIADLNGHIQTLREMTGEVG